MNVLNKCCAYCAGERSFIIKTEDDSNDITEHPHDDKPRPDLYTVCDKRFTVNVHRKPHWRKLVFMYSVSETFFNSQRPA